MESFIIYKIEGRKNFVNIFWKVPSIFRPLTFYFCAFQLNFNSIRCFKPIEILVLLIFEGNH